MKKTALVFCAALVAFAATPTAATATNNPELVENGARVEAGKSLQATSQGNLVATDLSGNTIWSCETVILTWDLLKNDGTNVEANITAATIKNKEASTCSSSIGATTVTTNPATNGLPWCIRSTSTMVTDEFQIRGNSCGSLARPIRLVFDLPFGIICTYQRPSAISGTFTTGIGKTVLSISKVEVPLLEGGFGCPSATNLDMSLGLETDGTNTRLDLI
jgi:hypothetical protein